MSATRDRKALADLLQSRGWAILKEQMHKEIVAAALLLGANGKMTVDEVNFRRGAIWAAQQLLDLPTKLDVLLQNDEAQERLADRDDLAANVVNFEPLDPTPR